MHRLWPASEQGPIDDAAFERLYTYPADRPWLTVSFVESADGAVEVGGRSGPLSNSTDRKVYRLGSDLADVVLLGAGTATVEDFVGIHPDGTAAERRRRHGLAPVPPIAVVSTGRTLEPDSPVITRAAVPTIVLTSGAAPEDLREAWAAAGADVVVAGTDGVDLREAVAALHARGLRRIDCEGGPHLFGALLADGLVDELRLTVSPMLVAGAAGRIAAGSGVEPTDVRLASVLAEDDTLMLRYLVGRRIDHPQALQPKD